MAEQSSRLEHHINLHIEVLKAMIEGNSKIAAENVKSVVMFSAKAISFLFLLNGTAAVATLYNFNTLKNFMAAETMLLLFSLGAAAAVATCATTYIAQKGFTQNTLLNINKMHEDTISNIEKIISYTVTEKDNLYEKTYKLYVYDKLFNITSIVLCITSLALFLFGCLYGYSNM